MSMAAVLYVRADCPFCAAARLRLAAQGRAFREIDVGRAPESIPELLKLTGGRRIVPVLVDGRHIAVAPDGGTEF